MLEQMKQQWETIMSDQQSTLRDMVNSTVTTALQKQNAKTLGDEEQKLGAGSAKHTQFYEQRIEQFEKDFAE